MESSAIRFSRLWQKRSDRRTSEFSLSLAPLPNADSRRWPLKGSVKNSMKTPVAMKQSERDARSGSEKGF